MSDELVCSHCQVPLEERELKTTAIVTDACPRCGAIVRRRDAFGWSNLQALIADDLSAIGAWLAAECEELRLSEQTLRDREKSGGLDQWQIKGDILAGCPDNWVIEVVYSTTTPEVLSLRLTAVESEWLEDGFLRNIVAVFRDHALQPHESRKRSIGDAAGIEELMNKLDSDAEEPGDEHAAPREQTRWGAKLYLSTAPLTQGLLRPAVSRLLTAMRDATVTRSRQNR